MPTHVGALYVHVHCYVAIVTQQMGARVPPVTATCQNQTFNMFKYLASQQALQRSSLLACFFPSFWLWSSEHNCWVVLVMRIVLNAHAEVHFQESHSLTLCTPNGDQAKDTCCSESIAQRLETGMPRDRQGQKARERKRSVSRSDIQLEQPKFIAHEQERRKPRVGSSWCSSMRPSLLACAALLAWIVVFRCVIDSRKTERCSAWLPEANISGLELALNHSLFGQHIATPIIVSHIKRHLSSVEGRTKPLTLLLYGPTGTGKTYASRIVGQHLFNSGIASRFWGRVFLPHVSALSDSKTYVKTLFQERIKQCVRKLYFVVEEADKGFEDDYFKDLFPILSGSTLLESGAGTANNAVVLLIVNFAAAALQKRVLDFRTSGRSRSSLTLSDVNVLSPNSLLAELRTPGSRLVQRLLADKVVDAVVPFLPLELEHVRQCVVSSMEDRGVQVTNERTDTVLKDFRFLPHEQPLFAVSGCKRVDRAVDLHFD